MKCEKCGSENTENALIEKFRAVIDNNNSISIFNKKKRSVCVIRRDLAKSYEIEVEASEAPILNKLLNDYILQRDKYVLFVDLLQCNVRV